MRNTIAASAPPARLAKKKIHSFAGATRPMSARPSATAGLNAPPEIGPPAYAAATTVNPIAKPKYELPADFLAQLTGAIRDFEESLSQRNVTKEAKSSATAGVGEAIEDGMKLLRQLDVVVKNKFQGDRMMLAAWTTAHHVEQVAAKRGTSGGGTPAPDSGTEPPKPLAS